MPFDVKAVRKAVPLLISVAGTSGSGKTYSSLLLASGIAGPTGKVAMIDTENGRGAMYVDSPGIQKALPNGYMIEQLDPPFTPRRYIELIAAAEKAGIQALVIDSTSHEWEGTGGCTEIAENNKLGGMPNWSKAKMEHKRFLNHCLSSHMDIIFCLRAREKVRIMKDERGKEQIIPQGLQPIAEKNFVFEMIVSLLLDEHTHFANPVKVPEPLVHLFPGQKLLTKEDGVRIREWNHTGISLDPREQLRKRARAAVDEGVAAYRDFWSTLSKEQHKDLAKWHEENKYDAEQADLARQKQAEQEKEMVNG